MAAHGKSPTPGGPAPWILLLALTAGCGEDAGAGGSPPPPPGSPAALQELAEELVRLARAGARDRLEARARELLLADAAAFFRRVYGEETGAALARGYEQRAPELASRLAATFAARAEEGRTRVRAVQHEDPRAPDVQGLLAEALERMQRPVPLFSLVFLGSSGQVPYRMWSFVQEDGGFRYLGRLPGLAR